MMRYHSWSFLLIICLALPLKAKAATHSGSKIKASAKVAADALATPVTDSSYHMVVRFNNRTLREEHVLVSSDGQPAPDSVVAAPADTVASAALETSDEPAVSDSSSMTTIDDSAASVSSTRGSLRGNPAIIVTEGRTAKAPQGNSKRSFGGTLVRSVIDTTSNATSDLAAGEGALMHSLARLTAYWAGEGDYYTGHRVSSTGIHLHGGHCAVDPSIIPYGSVVEIPGFGQFLAVDTGSAVVSRTAARRAGHTRAERGALVVDLFFEHRRDGERFEAENPKFVGINWWSPSSTGHQAREARSIFADEDWTKIYSKRSPLASL